MSIADRNKLAYVGSKDGRGGRDSDSWFTPIEYVEMARLVMGRIDLDPFSSDEANKVVRATRIFTVEDSAIGRGWCDYGRVNVWMNPPYGRGIINKAVDQFLAVYMDGQVDKAVVLVNNATETQWFQALITQADAMCLVNKRISFYNTDGKEVSGNTRGQIFLYFDVDGVSNFDKEFSRIGRVFKR